MPPTDPADPYNLERFVLAQKATYDRALSEIRNGRKQSHWMWFIFPQFQGLGVSSTSQEFAIKCLDEANAFLLHPVLGPRLRECAEAVLYLQNRTAFEVFGWPDEMKLRSCATLFARVAPQGSVFEKLLEIYFDGKPDEATLRLIRTANRWRRLKRLLGFVRPT